MATALSIASGVCTHENTGVLNWKRLRRELTVARIKAGLEEDELAKAIGIDVSTIYRIEKSASGKNNPSLDIIAKWVDQCGLSLSAFMALVEEGYEKRKTDDKLSPIYMTSNDIARPPAPAVPAQHVIENAAGAPDGTVGAVQGQPDFGQAILDLQEATKALRESARLYDTLSARPMVRAGRQASKAGATGTGHSKRVRKDR